MTQDSRRARSLLASWDRVAAATTDYGELLREAPRTVALGDAAALWQLDREDGRIGAVGWYDADPEGMRLLDDLHEEPPTPPGEGLVGEVWASATPVVVTAAGLADPHPALPSACRLWLSRFGTSGLALVPLRLRGEVSGVLGLARRAGQPPFADEDLRLLVEITDRLALVLDNARLLAAAQAAAARHAVLVRANDELARAALDLGGLVEAVVTTTSEGLGDPCILWRVRDDDPSRFGPPVVHHADPQSAALLRRHLASHPDAADQGLVPAVIAAGGLRAAVVSDECLGGRTRALDEYRRRYGLATAVGAPLRVRGRVTGALVACRGDAARPFSSDDLALVQALADRAAVALDSARLFAAVQGSERELRRASKLRRELLAHLVAAQEQERRRIAADVHDNSIQVMAAVELRLAVLRRRLDGLGAAEEAQTLDTLQRTVREATGRLRTLLFDLQPPQLDHGGLLAAMRQLADTLFEATGTDVEVSGEFTGEPPSDLQMVLYRIGQEALVNARKHANATVVRVSGRRADGGYELVVSDDGVGIAEPHLRPRHGHRGVMTMHERAEVAEGRLEVSGGPGAGTTVRVWVPDPGDRP
ncbi:MAG: GAF domain-containing sensor histidine kinase [Mycobacterium leprae]